LTGISVTEVTVNLLNNLLSQDNFAVNLLRLLYSTLAEERETVTCFLDFQDINLLTRNTTNPLTDFLLWGQEVQFTSQ